MNPRMYAFPQISVNEYHEQGRTNAILELSKLRQEYELNHFARQPQDNIARQPQGYNIARQPHSDNKSWVWGIVIIIIALIIACACMYEFL